MTAVQIQPERIGPTTTPAHHGVARQGLLLCGATLTDTMHIAFAMAWLLLMLLAIGFAAAAFGRRFRLYSGATVAVFVVFGALTIPDGARIAAGLPTPWVGVWERISIGASLLWLVVFATALLRRPSYDRATDGGSGSPNASFRLAPGLEATAHGGLRS
jgi:hypothetical protein